MDSSPRVEQGEELPSACVSKHCFHGREELTILTLPPIKEKAAHFPS